MRQKILNVKAAFIILAVVALAEGAFVNIPKFIRNSNSEFQYIDIDLTNVPENERITMTEQLCLEISDQGGEVFISGLSVPVSNICLTMNSEKTILQSCEASLLNLNGNVKSKDFMFYIYDINDNKHPVRKVDLLLNEADTADSISLMFEANTGVSFIERLEINPKLDYFVSVKRIFAFWLLGMFAYILSTPLLSKALGKRKINYIPSVLGGFLLSITIVAGTYTKNDIPFYIFDRDILCSILISSVFLSIAIIAFFELLTYMHKYICTPSSFLRVKTSRFVMSIHRLLKKLEASRFFFPMTWLFIFIAWIPCLLSEYPGILAYDSPQQFLEGVILNVWNNHHPILHTMFFSFLCKLSYNLSQGYEIGVAMYSVIQMLVLSYGFAGLCDLLRRKKVPMIIVIAVAACFGLLPSNSLLAVNMTKDVFFTAFFVLFMISVYNIMFDPEAFWAKRSDKVLRESSHPAKFRLQDFCSILRFVLITFLMCASRHQGIYIAAVTMPFLLIFSKGFRIKIFAAFSTILLIWWIYTGPVFSALGVEQSGVQEMLSVPIQGLSRTLVYQSGKLTESEKERIEAYIPNYKNYTPRLSDMVKSTFNNELFNESPYEFFKLWLSVGIKSPQTYIDSFFVNTDGYWNIFYDNYNTIGIYNRYIEIYSAIPLDVEAFKEYAHILQPDISIIGSEYDEQLVKVIDIYGRNSKFPRIHNFYQKIAEWASFLKIPFAGFLMNQGYCFLYLLLILLYAVYTKQYRFICIVVPPFTLFFTLLLGPISLMRYAYPIMCIFPLFLLLLFDKKDSQPEEISLRSYLSGSSQPIKR